MQSHIHTVIALMASDLIKNEDKPLDEKIFPNVALIQEIEVCFFTACSDNVWYYLLSYSI